MCWIIRYLRTNVAGPVSKPAAAPTLPGPTMKEALAGWRVVPWTSQQLTQPTAKTCSVESSKPVSRAIVNLQQWSSLRHKVEDDQLFVRRIESHFSRLTNIMKGKNSCRKDRVLLQFGIFSQLALLRYLTGAQYLFDSNFWAAENLLTKYKF